jgi:hypothetical protein
VYSDEHSLVLEITVSDGELVGKRHYEEKYRESTLVKKRKRRRQ